MINWGMVIGVTLLVIAVGWAIWWCKQMMPELRSIVKAIANYLKR